MVRPRLLVVEDEPDHATVLRMLFEAACCEVVVAEGLAAARRVLAGGERPHLVILDVLLHDGSGLDLCRELKAMRPAPFVLVLTALDQARVGGEARDAGADLLVQKPFDLDEVEAAVRQALEVTGRLHGPGTG